MTTKSVLLDSMTALQNSRVCGFTLIEILVMAAVIGIMVGGGMATYARYDRRQKVEQATLGFANQLRVVQKKADAGQRTNCVIQDLFGYEVTANNDSSSAIETETCGSGGGNIAAIPLAHKTVFKHANFGMKAIFRTLSRGVLFPDLPDYDGTILVTDADGLIQYQVEVTTGGYITVEKIL